MASGWKEIDFSDLQEDAGGDTVPAADLPQQKNSRGKGLPSLKDMGKATAGGFTGSIESIFEGLDWCQRRRQNASKPPG